MTMLPKHFCRRSHSKSSLSAFTLAELLVVIAMTAFLAVILMPILLRTRDASTLASCSNNLRQIGVGCNIYATANNDYWPCINLPGNVENFYQTSLACRTTSAPGTMIGDGPYDFGQLYFYAGLKNPKVFYCPAKQTGFYAYSDYNAPGYPWPSVTPQGVIDSGDNNPFVRCGYNYYPQSKTTTTVKGSFGSSIQVGAVTFVNTIFNPPNPPGGTTPNSSTEPAQLKTTQINLSKAVAVDSLTLWAQINHQFRGQPYGLNALFPDGHVRFQTIAGNNKLSSNEPLDQRLWDPAISGGPGETSYSSSIPAALIIMNGFQP